MDARVSLVTLGVHDFDRALRFYRDGLGWPLSSSSSDDVAFFRTGGIVLALYPRPLLAEDAHLPDQPHDAGVFNGIALAQNVREPGDVDATLATAAAAGATIVKPAEDTFWGGRSGYFLDTEGYAWEVAWNPHWPLGPDGAIQLPE